MLILEGVSQSCVGAASEVGTSLRGSLEPGYTGGQEVSWLQQEEGHSRGGWVSRAQHGSCLEIELAVAKVEVGGLCGISLLPLREISHV